MIIILPWSLLVLGLIFNVLPMMVQSLLRQPTPSQPCQRSAVTRPAPLLLQRQYQHQWKPSNPDTILISGKRGLQSTGSDNDEATNAQAEYAAEIEDLKSEITKYLQLRIEIGADDIAKEYVKCIMYTYFRRLILYTTSYLDAYLLLIINLCTLQTSR